MENPYAAPRGEIAAPIGIQAPLTWKQILFSFEGRIPRRTFWGFSILWQVIFGGLEWLIGSALGEESNSALALYVILVIPSIWVGLAIQVKRWHDRDKAGTWVLIVFLPIIGIIWMFIECGCLRGTQGANKYGEDPT